jgi:hypothetical protein
VRLRHVSCELDHTEDDLLQTKDYLLDPATEFAAAVFGWDRKTLQRVRHLLDCDVDYLRRWLFANADGETRKPQLIGNLEAAMGVKANVFSANSGQLADALEGLGILLALIFSARGAFHGSTNLRAVTVDAEIGADAHGEGVRDGRQHLLGLVMSGPDITVPLLLAPLPDSGFAHQQLEAELARMLSQIQGVWKRLTDYAEAAKDNPLLAALGIKGGVSAMRVSLPTTVLIPVLHVGPRSKVFLGSVWTDGDELTLALKQLTSELRPGSDPVYGWVIVETPHELPGDPHQWKTINPEALSRAFAKLRLVHGQDLGLGLAPRLESVTYQLRDDGRAVRRYQMDAPDVALFHTHRFTLEVKEGPVWGALLHAEFLATNGHTIRCPKRFVAEFTPALVSASKSDVRRLIRALRVAINVPFVAFGRSRQDFAFQQLG